MKRFKLAGQTQRFLSDHDGIHNLFSYISVIRHRPVKARAKLGARLVMSPRSASAVDQIACGCRKGQRPIADEVNKLGRFDAEIHMRTSVSALAELMVRIHSPPPESLRTFGSFDEGVFEPPDLLQTRMNGGDHRRRRRPGMRIRVPGRRGQSVPRCADPDGDAGDGGSELPRLRSRTSCRYAPPETCRRCCCAGTA